MLWISCALIFFAAYIVQTTMISIFYHRGLAHGAVRLHPAARWYAEHLGIWITGLDPKGWVAMHRLHHDHSDTELDPHSPVHFGLVGVFLQQLKSYEKILVLLAKKDAKMSAVVADLDFDISRINRLGVWWLPYVVHAGIGLGLALIPLALGATGAWWLVGVSYWLGMMSHPVEGGIVNSLGHAWGKRNFDTTDNSRNNHLAAWLILGEGFQNNHHAHPASAKFSLKRLEFDPGFAVAKALEFVGVLEIVQQTRIDVVERERRAKRWTSAEVETVQQHKRAA